MGKANDTMMMSDSSFVHLWQLRRCSRFSFWHHRGNLSITSRIFIANKIFWSSGDIANWEQLDFLISRTCLIRRPSPQDKLEFPGLPHIHLLSESGLIFSHLPFLLSACLLSFLIILYCKVPNSVSCTRYTMFYHCVLYTLYNVLTLWYILNLSMTCVPQCFCVRVKRVKHGWAYHMEYYGHENSG